MDRTVRLLSPLSPLIRVDDRWRAAPSGIHPLLELPVEIENETGLLCVKPGRPSHDGRIGFSSQFNPCTDERSRGCRLRGLFPARADEQTRANKHEWNL